jgi:hypothetical protein
MNPTTLPSVRQATRALTQTTNTSTRFASSSSARPIAARRAPRKTLRSLVELHHKSSTFLPNTSTSTIAQGVALAFQRSKRQWQEYNSRLDADSSAYALASSNPVPFLPEVTRRHAQRGLGGIEEFRDHTVGDARVGGAMRDGDVKIKASKPAISAWIGEQAWNNVDRAALLSEREARVNEALHGTYLGSSRNSVDIGLEGVEEYTRAVDEAPASMRQKWMRRNRD